jgi:hypothetical protein
MANLVSPGVQVTVTDESVYGPAGSGTVPMLFIATGENKADPTGTEADGIAKYTKASQAGKPVLVTSQRELTQYFGNVDFRKVAGSVVQGDETNDYGLLAAYSFLGQSSAAYIVRANVDTAALRPQSSEPVGPAANNTYWLNPANTSYGLFVYNGSSWVLQTPTVEITTGGGGPSVTVVNGNYLVVIDNGATSTEISYWIGQGGNWVALDSTWNGGGALSATYAPHYSQPAAAVAGDVWVKTTQPGGGLDLDLSLYTTSAGDFIQQQVLYVQTASPSGASSDVFQDGSVGATRNLLEGDIWVSVLDGALGIARYDATNSEWDDIATDDSVATGGFVIAVSTSEPVGNPTDGTVWYDPDLNQLEVFEIALDGGANKWARIEAVTYSSVAPSGATAGDYWVNTTGEYPTIYRHNGADWVLKDNTDQATNAGVVFGDIYADETNAGDYVASVDVLPGGPNPLIFPVGTTGINMCRSGGTVRVYDASLGTTWKWRNLAGNHADGSGAFGRKAQRKVVVTAMQASASGTELREDTVQFRLLAAPGYPELFDEMVALNSDRNETAFVIVDAPFRANPTAAIAWVQGTSATENGEDGLVGRSTYAAAYYPSVLTTNPATGDSVVAPASHSVLYTYAYSDNVSYQWFAPAGLTRGVVQNASNVGYINAEGDFVAVSLTQGSRDTMYENKLNPIARFPAEGIIVFGQKTLAAGASALDRVNVARLTAYLRERFAVIGRPYLFEPNDTSTRRNAKGTFDGFMGNILAQRGVYDFAVVCDETNNTPARIDRNELWIDVAIEPTKAAEFIYIPIRIVNTGELS